MHTGFASNFLGCAWDLRSLHPIHWSLPRKLSGSRQSAAADCFTAYPRGSRSRVFVIWHLFHSFVIRHSSFVISRHSMTR